MYPTVLLHWILFLDLLIFEGDFFSKIQQALTSGPSIHNGLNGMDAVCKIFLIDQTYTNQTNGLTHSKSIQKQIAMLMQL